MVVIRISGVTNGRPKNSIYIYTDILFDLWIWSSRKVNNIVYSVISIRKDKINT